MTCEDFERGMMSDDPRDREAWEAHARACPSCARRLAWERRLDRAARALRPVPPEGLEDAILASLAREKARRRRPVWARSRLRWAAAAALAASCLVMVGIRELHEPRAPSATPELLSPARLALALEEEARLDAALAAARGTARAPTAPAPTAPAPTAPAPTAPRDDAREEPRAVLAAPLDPVREEIAYLDEAIGECREALRENSRHAALRRTLHDLTRRKLELLRGTAPAAGGRQG